MMMTKGTASPAAIAKLLQEQQADNQYSIDTYRHEPMTRHL
ncbi:MAG TPA: hypothetical protein VJ729_09295 [Nitrososphaeraceae archaeon]|nr:hypothetical protein [Nitrososphaeraceae archaeon]